MSESQERLSALLKKTFDVIPFATDEECDHIFFSIASFCRKAQENSTQKAPSHYESYSINDLIDLSKSIEFKSGEKRPRNSLEYAEGCNIPSGHVSRWTFESAYNIVEVVSFELASKQLLVMARPPVAGNKAPSQYIMEVDDLRSIDVRRGKQAKLLREKLGDALVTYCVRNPDGPWTCIVDLIRPFPWAASVVQMLQGVMPEKKKK